jgi:hypothetical protein
LYLLHKGLGAEWRSHETVDCNVKLYVSVARQEALLADLDAAAGEKTFAAESSKLDARSADREKLIVQTDSTFKPKRRPVAAVVVSFSSRAMMSMRRIQTFPFRPLPQ